MLYFDSNNSEFALTFIAIHLDNYFIIFQLTFLIYFTTNYLKPKNIAVIILPSVVQLNYQQ